MTDRMTVDNDAPSPRESRFKAAARSIRRFIKRFGSWVGISYLAVASLLSYLVHFHAWPERWEIVPVHELPAFAFVVGLMFILSEQVKEYSEEFYSMSGTLKQRVTALDEDVVNLAGQVTPQLKLHQCIEKLALNLTTVPRGSVLTIHHIALDMQTAWLHVREKIFDVERAAQRNQIRYQLLLVSGDAIKPANETPQLQNQLTQMRERARFSLEVIKEYFASGNSDSALIEVEIRTYTSLPVIHGLFADKPAPVHFVTFAGWRGAGHTNYHWGEGHYHEIKGSPETATAAGDIADLFDGHFAHLWENGKQAYKSPSAAANSRDPHLPAAQGDGEPGHPA